HAVLENGLRVVNIWDPNTTQAAVSVAVTVGSFSDPEGFDGLAHLTEHAMFLGSENYPQQSGFDIWLAQHGGSSNAYTAEEQTVYYVSTSEKAFEQCLRRFADVFRAPLFNASWIWDEVRAVDSEHNKNRKSQEWQVHQLINFMAADGSQMGRFHTGNEHTLRRTNKEKLASKIQGFFSANYCPPRMRLVTFGPQSLEEQLAKARATFGNIPRGTCRTEAPSFESPEAFPQRSLQKMLRMQGMSTMPELHLVFPMANLQPWARRTIPRSTFSTSWHMAGTIPCCWRCGTGWVWHPQSLCLQRRRERRLEGHRVDVAAARGGGEAAGGAGRFLCLPEPCEEQYPGAEVGSAPLAGRDGAAGL
ncbi:unnamed protein product, partial [Effrenium voratum]